MSLFRLLLKMNSKVVTLFAAIYCILDIAHVSGFSGQLSRRQSLQAVVGGIATAALPSVVPLLPASAVVDEETPRVVTRMGGLLVSADLCEWVFVPPISIYTHSVCGVWSLLSRNNYFFLYLLLCYIYTIIS
jgi:hypothetical protein